MNHDVKSTEDVDNQRACSLHQRKTREEAHAAFVQWLEEMQRRSKRVHAHEIMKEQLKAKKSPLL